MPRTRANAVPWDPRFATHPALREVAAAAARLGGFCEFPSVAELDAALAELFPRRDDAGRYRLAAQRPRPRGAPLDPGTVYDVVIDARGEIPTRAGDWHDLMNALVWASYPRAKARVSARQRRLVEARRAALGPGAALPSSRTRAQDALALLDEGGALVLCDRSISNDLARALVDEASARLGDTVAAGRAAVLAFGHALFEHAVHALPARASPVLLPVERVPGDWAARRALADAALAARLDDDGDLNEPPLFPALPWPRGAFWGLAPEVPQTD